jgi:general secretion pathway protein D
MCQRPPVAAQISEPGAPSNAWFLPQPGLNAVELDELMEVAVSHLRVSHGYRPATDHEAAAQPATPVKLDRTVRLVRDVDGQQRIVQIGYRTFRSQPPHLWVFGWSGTGENRQGNPDVADAAELVKSGRAALDAQNAQLKAGDLETATLTLSYIEADRCLAILKTLGYETVEFSDPSQKKAPGKSSVIDPMKPVDPTKLPIVVSVPGPDATDLVGGAKVTAGAFGLGITPTVASELPNNTSAAPLMQLMVLYHPAKPEQLQQVTRRIRESIDLPARQILMEAMVLEISETSLKQLGIQWELQGPTGDLELLKMGKLPDNLTVTNSTLDLSVRDIFGEFRARVRALVRDGKAEILSRPSVLTLDNRQASIRIGEEIPVATSIAAVAGTSTLSFNFTYVPTGILLNIRPRTNSPGDEVSCQIDGTVSDRVPGQDLVMRAADGTILATAPRISTRRVQTHIRIANNTPFIIGGLVARDDTETVDKVPILGDIPIVGGLFRTTTADKQRNEVIIVITPFVLPDERVPGRNLPKDEDAFDSFDNQLFRDAYRIRAEDVFDLTFLRDNRALRDAQAAAERSIRDNLTLASRYPFDAFAGGRVPGEELFVYRQMYEVINRLGVDEDVHSDRIIFFNADRRWTAGFSVTFIDRYLRQMVEVPEGKKRQDLTAVFAELERRGKALAMTFRRDPTADASKMLAEPVPTVELIDCPDDETWASQLWQRNLPDEDGVERSTIILRKESDLTRLKRAIILKRTVQINTGGQAPTLDQFSLGRLLLIPDAGEDKVYLIDAETARYFFITEHYYPAFEEQLTRHTRALRQAIQHIRDQDEE